MGERTRRDDRSMLRAKVEIATILVTTPVVHSPTPSRKKGIPLTHALLPLVFALRVHAEFSICVLFITQRPTPKITTHRTKVIDLFTTLFYHRTGPKSWQSSSRRRESE